MLCEVEGCTEHYGCRLKAKGIQLSNKVTATRTKNMRPTPSIPPAINAQIIYDERPGGVKMPLMNPDGTVVRHKQYRDNEAKIEAIRRHVRADTPTQGS